MINNLPIGIVQQQSVPAVYDPGMMTFDGSTGYYNHATLTNSGNKFTHVAGFRTAQQAGSDFAYVMETAGPIGWGRGMWLVKSSNPTAADRNKLIVSVRSNSGLIICQFRSINVVTDSQKKTVFFSFDGDIGAALFRINGVDADDLTYPGRVVPTTGTLDAGVGKAGVGATFGGLFKFDGDIGYCGYRDAYLTNDTDFFDPVGGLQSLDEVGWSEWGAQPLLWNEFGTMDDNKGSATNMTKNGTITGPA